MSAAVTDQIAQSRRLYARIRMLLIPPSGGDAVLDRTSPESVSTQHIAILHQLTRMWTPHGVGNLQMDRC